MFLEFSQWWDCDLEAPFATKPQTDASVWLPSLSINRKNARNYILKHLHELTLGKCAEQLLVQSKCLITVKSIKLKLR